MASRGRGPLWRLEHLLVQVQMMPERRPRAWKRENFIPCAFCLFLNSQGKEKFDFPGCVCPVRLVGSAPGASVSGEDGDAGGRRPMLCTPGSRRNHGTTYFTLCPKYRPRVWQHPWPKAPGCDSPSN